MSVRQVDIDEGLRLREGGHVLVDVREPFEWDAGHVPGALHIPLGNLPESLAQLPDRDAGILLHCRSGARSGRAAEYLVAQGYTNVANLDALISDWPARGGAWEEPATAVDGRYARQVVVPEVGPSGQRRLQEARVLVVGAGGLGSPACLYLAASGVGTLGIVDDDIVEESNLGRQPLHATERIGTRKVDSAAEALRAINPQTVVVRHAERLGRESAERLIGAYDVIVDGTDNLDTRFVLNDAAVRLRRTVVHASVYRWEAQVTTLVPFEGPCYRCIYPAQPSDELAPDCDTAGVVGVVPGVAGLLQAAETIKVILGVGETLMGRVLTFDALAMSFETLRAERDPTCPACGSNSQPVSAASAIASG